MKVEGLSELVYDSEEQLEPLEGNVVSGTLPEGLSGALYRVGPAKFSLGLDYHVNHWFDGLAMAVKYHIKDGRATIQKRFVATDAYCKAIKHGKLIYTEFGSRGHPDPDAGFISRVIATIIPSDMTDNCFNNVFRINSLQFAAAETSLLTQIDPQSLAAVEKVDVSKYLGVDLCCSHPITDVDGSVYTLGISVMPKFKYQVNRISPVEKAACGKDAFARASTVVTHPSSWSTAYSFYHSFALTEHYILFLEQPLILVLSKVLMMVVKGNSLKDCVQWHPEYKVKIFVAAKDTGKLVKTKYLVDEAFFCNHLVNAYEENGQIVLDAITYKTPSVLDSYLLKNMRACEVSADPGRVTRMVIPLITDMKQTREHVNLATVGSCSATATRRGDTILIKPHFYQPSNVEFPTINPSYRGRRYRYLYAPGLWDQEFFRNALGRLDLETGEWSLWRAGDGRYPLEATLVARPHATAEDDGLLLLSVLGTGGAADQLVALDARSLETLARVEFPCRTPLMFHTLWTPDAPGVP